MGTSTSDKSGAGVLRQGIHMASSHAGRNGGCNPPELAEITHRAQLDHRMQTLWNLLWHMPQDLVRLPRAGDAYRSGSQTRIPIGLQMSEKFDQCPPWELQDDLEK